MDRDLASSCRLGPPRRGGRLYAGRLRARLRVVVRTAGRAAGHGLGFWVLGRDVPPWVLDMAADHLAAHLRAVWHRRRAVDGPGGAPERGMEAIAVQALAVLAASSTGGAGPALLLSGFAVMFPDTWQRPLFLHQG